MADILKAEAAGYVTGEVDDHLLAGVCRQRRG